jgi:hypothetical protein
MEGDGYTKDEIAEELEEEAEFVEGLTDSGVNERLIEEAVKGYCESEHHPVAESSQHYHHCLIFTYSSSGVTKQL